MRIFAAVLLGALLPTTVLAADTPPPAGAMKLSAVLAALESRVGDQLAYIDEADWDDDGYWEVEYRGADGAEVKVKLDAMTGEPRP
ncbi:PepSY domain-containing protein [Paracoccus luteus]|uniref:PepSY domain-containing protein n=1 Tax=Paracoccus luteus TaxID=2508543 RepID=UPI00106FE39A|nr:PepSY domain-containing protein [Paracoccus luteus]